MAGRKKNKDDNIRKKKILGVLLLFLAVLLFLSLITHSHLDDQRILAEDNPFRIDFANQAGTAGALTSYLFYFFFGWLSILVPFFIVIAALRLIDVPWRDRISKAVWYVSVAAVLATMMTNVYRLEELELTVGHAGANGGYLFYHLSRILVKIIGTVGSIILLGAGLVVTLILVGYRYPVLRQRLSLPSGSKAIGFLDYWRRAPWKKVSEVLAGPVRWFRSKVRRAGDDLPVDETSGTDDVYEGTEVSRDTTETDDKTKGSRDGGRKETGKRPARKLKAQKRDTAVGRETQDYVFPGMDLLVDNPESGPAVSGEELSTTAGALRNTLETFNISIQDKIEHYPGPVITRFEFKPGTGIKVHQITNLADDLALALQAKRVRIVAPIPGKAAVGIEIPNRRIRKVYIKDIIGSKVYSESDLQLPLALGMTIGGRPYVTDLSRMPHLLIAGATGSGKSVCINTIITSLMYRLHPRELKFIFIDPKMLELSVYAGIPYLGRPVVTNPKRAEKVLSDAVGEMESRYKKLAGMGVRNITDYNARQKEATERIPYIVIVVDELADMMMSSSSTRIEMLITRLAQMARAVGIHLILATQRPSVDVITGLIKANFSARIAFQVATKIDSRTIIDGNGAEKLLGCGDMLFLLPGQPEPIRLHGAFISSEETEKIVSFINEQFPREEKPEGASKADEQEDELEDVDVNDPLFVEAVQTVIRHKMGSVSLLQRKLGIGYQRAARLIDDLEKAGVVGKYDGSKAREVLVDNTFIEKLMASRTLSDSNRH